MKTTLEQLKSLYIKKSEKLCDTDVTVKILHGEKLHLPHAHVSSFYKVIIRGNLHSFLKMQVF